MSDRSTRRRGVGAWTGGGGARPGGLRAGLLAALLLAVPAAGGDLAALFDNPVIVKGRGFEIRQLDLDDSMAALKATLATQNQAIPPSEEPALRERMLERMVLTRLLMLRATPDDKDQAKVLAEKFIADTKSKAPSEESYRRQLIATGLKPEAFEARALEQAIVEKVLDRELKAKVQVTDEEVRELYLEGLDRNARELEQTVKKLATGGQQHTEKYTEATNRLAEIRRFHLGRLERPEQARAHLILFYTVDPVTRGPLGETERVAKLTLISNTVQRLKAGADFAAVAREVSEDPDVTRTGGEYTVSVRTEMAPELHSALFRLPVGQISDPIATGFGIYLAQVKERIPPGKVPFEQVAAELREILLTQGVEQRLPAFAADLRKEYSVEVLKPR